MREYRIIGGAPATGAEGNDRRSPDEVQKTIFLFNLKENIEDTWGFRGTLPYICTFTRLPDSFEPQK